MADKIVTTTEEKVREAAEACTDARTVLKLLFPDVFKSKFNHNPTLNYLVRYKKDGSIGLLLSERYRTPIYATLYSAIPSSDKFTIIHPSRSAYSSYSFRTIEEVLKSYDIVNDHTKD